MNPQLPLEVELALVARLQDGDIAARNELVMDSYSNIQAKASKYSYACRMEPDDLAQELHAYVLKEAFKYKYADGKRFRAFVSLVLVSAIGNTIVKGNRIKRNRLNWHPIIKDAFVSFDYCNDDIKLLEHVVSLLGPKDQRYLLARIDFDNLEARIMPEAAKLLGEKLASYNRFYYMAVDKVKTVIKTSNIDFPYDLNRKEYFFHTHEAERKKVALDSL